MKQSLNRGLRFCGKPMALTRTRSGFTLVEVLVAMVIIGVLISIASSQISANLPEWRVKGAANETVSAFQKARALAVKKNKFALVDITSIGNVTANEVSVWVDENHSTTVEAGTDTMFHKLVVNNQYPKAFITSSTDGGGGTTSTFVLTPEGVIRGGIMPITITFDSTAGTLNRTYKIVVERTGIARLQIN